jgi:hypothetical protein
MGLEDAPGILPRHVLKSFTSWKAHRLLLSSVERGWPKEDGSSGAADAMR